MEQNRQEENAADGYNDVHKLLNTIQLNTAKNDEIALKVTNINTELVSLLKRTDQIVKDTGTIFKSFENFTIIEYANRERNIKHLFTIVDENLSNQHLDRVKKYEKKSTFLKYVLTGSVFTLISSLFILGLSVYFAQNWYAENVRTKSEIREEIFREISADGQSIYNKNDVDNLVENDRLLKLWIIENPSKAESFIQFRQGYKSKK